MTMTGFHLFCCFFYIIAGILFNIGLIGCDEVQKSLGGISRTATESLRGRSRFPHSRKTSAGAVNTERPQGV